MSFLDKIKNELAQMKPELSQKFFVNKIGLFGSVTRNDFTRESDIDIVVDFNKPVGIEFIDLADYLENRLNRKIDLLSLKGIKANYFETIKNKIIYV